MITHSRYSQHARRAMSHARLLARENGHMQMDSTHLFIGILHEGGSVGCNILNDLQLDPRRAERAFRQLPRAAGADGSSGSTTPLLQRALLLASDASKQLGQHYVGTEHLLLGLVHSGESRLLTLLYTLGVTSEQIRRRILRLLQDGITEIGLEQARRVAALSELSRRVLNGAGQIAELMGHKTVGLAHLLMALTMERRSVCAEILRQGGLNAVALEANLAKPRPVIGGVLGDIIDRAVDRAHSFGSHYVGTDHLLLTLALDRRGARLLRRYGCDPQIVVTRIRSQLAR